MFCQRDAVLILGMFLLRREAREINGPFRIVTDE
jgi:hypothetical protein